MLFSFLGLKLSITDVKVGTDVQGIISEQTIIEDKQNYDKLSNIPTAQSTKKEKSLKGNTSLLGSNSTMTREITLKMIIHPLFYGIVAYVCICVAHAIKSEPNPIDSDLTEDIPQKENISMQSINLPKLEVLPNSRGNALSTNDKNWKWRFFTEAYNNVFDLKISNRDKESVIGSKLKVNYIANIHPYYAKDAQSLSMFGEENWY